MRVKNTTEWPDYFLRRMVSWCCKQVGLPPSWMRECRFGNRSRGCWSGHGGGRRILVRIGPASAYPVKAFLYPGRKHEEYLGADCADRLDGLVAVTVHELTHCRQSMRSAKLPQIRARRRGIYNEAETQISKRKCVELFQQNREQLIAEWSAPPATKAKPVKSLRDKRAEKANRDLDRWQRKLKLAQTKVRKLKRRVSYYEQATAASRT